MPSPPRSTRAVAIGFAVVAVLTLAGYIAARILGLLRPGIVPPDHDLFLFNLCYLLFAMIGGCVTAHLAPEDPRSRSITLGVILTVLALPASVAQSFAGYGPDWFGWLLVLSGLPGAWLGGKILFRRS